MNRNERHIIVWGEGRPGKPAPHRSETQGASGRPSGRLFARHERLAAHPELIRRVEDLVRENARLRAEVLELRRMNQDLEGSAEIWVTLFERQVARTQSLEAQLKARRKREDS